MTKEEIVKILSDSSQKSVIGWAVEEDDFNEVAERIVKLCNLQSVNQQREQLAIAALNKIAHPIKYLQDEAEKDGCRLDGYMAIQLTKDANFYQEIADKALKAIANCG